MHFDTHITETNCKIINGNSKIPTTVTVTNITTITEGALRHTAEQSRSRDRTINARLSAD